MTPRNRPANIAGDPQHQAWAPAGWWASQTAAKLAALGEDRPARARLLADLLDASATTYGARLVEFRGVQRGGEPSLDALRCVAQVAPLVASELRALADLQDPDAGGEEDPNPPCSNPAGHSWVVEDREDESARGEGRCYCQWCGADGDG